MTTTYVDTECPRCSMEFRHLIRETEAQPVDIEALKQSDAALDDYNHAGKAHVKGWNACIDHLAATGRLGGVSKQPENEKQQDLSLECTDHAVQDALDWLNGWQRMLVQADDKIAEMEYSLDLLLRHSKTIRKALMRPAVPEGYALVPLEPTEEMAKAWNITSDSYFNHRSYRSMLAAAPKQGD